MRSDLAKVELLSITPQAEALIERAARTCHRSRVSKEESSRAAFIRKIIKLGHLSVLEHACATFRIVGGSRAFSHQLVRHRLCTFSQRSQRYVSETDLSFVVPPSVQRDERARDVFNRCILETRDAYRTLIELGVPKEDARFVLPNATATEIVMTANLREYRHIFRLRCHPTAQWEIRQIAMEMLRILKSEVPAAFDDFVISKDGKSAHIVEGQMP